MHRKKWKHSILKCVNIYLNMIMWQMLKERLFTALEAIYYKALILIKLSENMQVMLSVHCLKIL